MFDIPFLLLYSFIITIPILIFCVSHTVYTIAKAKKNGIVRMVYPMVNGYFITCIIAALCFGAASVSCIAEAREHNAFISEIESRGTAALENHYEHELTEREISILHSEKNYHAVEAETATERAVCWAVNAAVFIMLAATCGAFITKDGVLIMGWFSPERPYAVVKNGKICIYDETEPGKLFLKLRATDKNIELCNNFIRPEVLNSAEPAEQN